MRQAALILDIPFRHSGESRKPEGLGKGDLHSLGGILALPDSFAKVSPQQRILCERTRLPLSGRDDDLPDVGVLNDAADNDVHS